MKNYFYYFIITFLAATILTSCINYRKLITDEIVLSDENSQTGTIIKSDSINLKIEKIDESISIIPWTIVDTIIGKKLKTLWFGTNMGYYNTPYFSVFRNESFVGKHTGMQLKIGLAARGDKLFYLHYFFSNTKPYPVNKFGLGYQQYLGGRNYLTDNCFFWGSELNLMNVKLNNGPQITLEPYTGFEKKYNERLRIHFKFGLQFNLANENNQTGFNMSIGVHFMKRNFKKYYETLIREHRIPRK